MNRECADCKLPLEQIWMIDATQPGLTGKGAAHIQLQYAPVDATVSWFSKSVKGALPVTGLICPQCRRISLFG